MKNLYSFIILTFLSVVMFSQNIAVKQGAVSLCSEGTELITIDQLAFGETANDNFAISTLDDDTIFIVAPTDFAFDLSTVMVSTSAATDISAIAVSGDADTVRVIYSVSAIGRPDTIYVDGLQIQSLTGSPSTASAMAYSLPSGLVFNQAAVDISVTSETVGTVTISDFVSVCDSVELNYTSSTSYANQTYKWFVNGVDVGGTTDTLAIDTLSQDAQVYLEVISSDFCTDTISSTVDMVTVNPNVTPQIIIQTLDSDSTVCITNSIGFDTVSTMHQGLSPVYNWRVNGVNTFSGATFSSSVLDSGDVIDVELVSSLSCVTSSIAISNSIPVKILSSITPTVNITSDLGDSICLGATIIYTANVFGEGATPAYNWFVEGNPVGAGLNTFTSAAIADYEDVTVQLISSDDCAVGGTVTSAPYSMRVFSNETALVSILSDKVSNEACSGDLVIFTATPSQGGVMPSYQWRVNGNPEGGDSAKFHSTALMNSDVVTVDMATSQICTTPSLEVSNSETMVITMTPSVPTAIVVDNNVCLGTDTLTARIQPSNNAVNYNWILSNGNISFNSVSTDTIAEVTAQTLGSTDIEVRAENGTCYSSYTPATVVVQNSTPSTSAITGTLNPGCRATVNYSVIDNSASRYIWSVPLGATITSGQGSNSIIADLGTSNGVVKVIEIDQNGCTTEKRGNSYMDFQGTDNDQFITLPLTNKLEVDSGSIAFWIKPEENLNQLIFAYRNNTMSDEFINLRIANNRILEFTFREDVSVSQEIPSSSFNSWRHVAITWDETTKTIALFMDGVKVSTTFTQTFTHSLDVRVGKYLNGTPLMYNGLMDDLVLFDRALSSGEVAAVYSSSSADLSGVVAQYDFNNTFTSTVPDIGSNGYDGNYQENQNRVASTDENESISISSVFPVDVIGCDLTASFTPSQLITCERDSVVFYNTSNGDLGTIYTYQFGGNASPSSHTYTYNGIHDTVVVYFDGGGTGFLQNVTLNANLSGVVDDYDVDIMVNEKPSVTTDVISDVDCRGNSTGQARALASGNNTPFTYLWSPNAVNNDTTLANLAEGTHQIVLSDINGCSDTATVEIDEPTTSIILDTIYSSAASAFGASDGTATVEVDGGTIPYSFNWTPDPLDMGTDDDSIATGLSRNTYSVVVIDDNGCQLLPIPTINVTEPLGLTSGTIGAINGTDTVVGVNLCRDSLFPAFVEKLVPLGGTPPYSYEWEYKADFNGAY
ncbi:LamG domain-containing protein, partial [Cyclobacteriaceae bacterium]|nr:LamG domain-containing protein [Cyclobacteriaceae bacterium]